MHRLIPLVLALLLPTLHAADPLKAYPKAEEGMTRHVLPLPAEKDESSLRIELILGKTVEIDTANSYSFSGAIETKTIEGWGYSYHILPKIGPMIGTMMAVPPDAPRKKRFIAIGGEPSLIRYNSKLPVVIYVPVGVEVRYRLWRGDAESTPIDPD
ncbi:ecotin [Haloferula sp.]|uniref:ecotin n=1 Tax=Haloferula sp. TaxID=2497595 RepID=UPI00329E44E5